MLIDHWIKTEQNHCWIIFLNAVEWIVFPDTYGEADIVSNTTDAETTSVTSLLVSILVNSNVTADPTEASNSTSTWDTAGVTTTTSLPIQTTCINGTSYKLGIEPTDFSAIPTKEIIIVIFMLLLWFYSLMLTRKAWYKLLKEWFSEAGNWVHKLKYHWPTTGKKSLCSVVTNVLAGPRNTF